MKYRVEMRTRDDGTDGREITYRGTVAAPTVLNAVGQACLRFGVRTEQIVALSIELDENGPTSSDQPN